MSRGETDRREYLKHRRSTLLARRFRYLEPVGDGRWEPLTLERNRLLSLYFCSAWSLDGGRVNDGVNCR